MIPADELICDSFAGGGGASLGIYLATGRHPDVAINHDAEAIALHEANHPQTHHYREDVWKVDPHEATGGRRVGLMWLSPDCKHFSKAKGGAPVSKRVRGLAWVAVRWAKAVQPRVIILENVEEFQTWGPVGDDGRPCQRRRGLTFRRFVGRLRNLGYEVQWRELRACDYGAPTIRKRLFLIARCDGQPIVWPKPTHDKHGRQGMAPWRTAAECIDWSVPCPSIFLTPAEAKAWGKANGRPAPKRPLAEATQKRIAAGLRKYVLETPRPFIVQIQNASSGDTPLNLDAPLRTITAHPKGGGFALVAPHVTPLTHHGDNRERSLTDPMPTITGAHRGEYALVSAFLAKHQSERDDRQVQAASLFDPTPTVKTRDSNALVTAHIVKMRGENVGHAADEPLHTLSAGGTHFAEVRAFLCAYYGNEKDGQDLFSPVRTVTTRDRYALVTVEGQDYAIADIGMRMLEARELYRAQGFPCNEITLTIEVCPDREHRSQRGRVKDADDCSSSDSRLEQSRPAVVNVRTHLGADDLQIDSHGRSLSLADSAVELSPYLQHIGIGNFAALAARIASTLDPTTTGGRVASLSSDGASTPAVSGVRRVVLSASEIIAAANGAELKSRNRGEPSTFTTSLDGRGSLSSALSLETLCCYAAAAIAGCTQSKIGAESSFTIELKITSGYRIELQFNGKPLSKEAQVRMVGNSVAPDVAAALVRANFASDSARVEVAA